MGEAGGGGGHMNWESDFLSLPQEAHRAVPLRAEAQATEHLHMPGAKLTSAVFFFRTSKCDLVLFNQLVEKELLFSKSSDTARTR